MSDPKKTSDFLETANRAINRANEGAEGANGQILLGGGRIRGKFLGALLVAANTPVLLYTLVSPLHVLYTIGALLPMAVLIWICRKAGESPVSTAISLTHSRYLYCAFLLVAIFLHLVFGCEFAIAWYVSAFSFALLEPNLRRFFFSIFWL